MVKRIEFRLFGFEVSVQIRHIKGEHPLAFHRYKVASRRNTNALRAALLQELKAHLKS